MRWNFNSIKVRLKRNLVNGINGSLVFQFHKGTIKTYTFEKQAYQDSPFQFHKGTIKTRIRTKAAEFKGNFNSIKVRLKHASPRKWHSTYRISIP